MEAVWSPWRGERVRDRCARGPRLRHVPDPVALVDLDARLGADVQLQRQGSSLGAGVLLDLQDVVSVLVHSGGVIGERLHGHVVGDGGRIALPLCVKSRRQRERRGAEKLREWVGERQPQTAVVNRLGHRRGAAPVGSRRGEDRRLRALGRRQVARPVVGRGRRVGVSGTVDGAYRELAPPGTRDVHLGWRGARREGSVVE